MKKIILLLTLVLSSAVFSYTMFEKRALRDLYKNNLSVVQIKSYSKDKSTSYVGTGFFIDSKGTIITNEHVIAGFVSGKYSQISITNYKGESLKVTSIEECLKRKYKKIDLCRLKVSTPSKYWIKVPASKVKVSIGQNMYGIGMCTNHSWKKVKTKGLEVIKNYQDKYTSRKNQDITMLSLENPPCGKKVGAGGDSGGPLILEADSSLIGVMTQANTVNSKKRLYVGLHVNELVDLKNIRPIYKDIDIKKNTTSPEVIDDHIRTIKGRLFFNKSLIMSLKTSTHAGAKEKRDFFIMQNKFITKYSGIKLDIL